MAGLCGSHRVCLVAVLFVLLVFVLAVVIAVVVMTAIVIIIVVTAAAVVAVFVAQGTTGRAANTGTDQAASGTTDLAADYLAASRANAAADGGFGAIALVGTDGTARRTTDACADHSTGATADLLADHSAEYAAEGTTNGAFSVVAGDGQAGGQAEGEKQKSKLHDMTLTGGHGAHAERCLGALQARSSGCVRPVTAFNSARAVRELAGSAGVALALQPQVSVGRWQAGRVGIVEWDQGALFQPSLFGHLAEVARKQRLQAAVSLNYRQPLFEAALEQRVVAIEGEVNR